jgi:hypothetical protein
MFSESCEFLCIWQPFLSGFSSLGGGMKYSTVNKLIIMNLKKVPLMEEKK